MTSVMSAELCRQIHLELKCVEDEMSAHIQALACCERKRDACLSFLQEYGSLGQVPAEEPPPVESAQVPDRPHPEPAPPPEPNSDPCVDPDAPYEDVDLAGARNYNERLRRIGRVVCSQHGQRVNLTRAARCVIVQTQSIQDVGSMRSKLSVAISHMWEYRRVANGYYWYDETESSSDDHH